MTASHVDRRVLVFGDSIVAGTGDPQALGWVGRVVAASWAAGLPLTAYQLGVRRETSLQVAARWRAEALPRLADGAVSRVAFSFGVNDATVEEGRERVAPATSAATLDGVLDDARELGLPAFVVGPAPVADAAHSARVRLLSERFADVCARHAVPYVAVADALVADGAWAREAAAGDGAHPAAAGYEALARLVLGGGWLQWLR
ncbi:MAG: acyl-CoA thioesterase [Solirubrobacteraceae bacterium]|nr:acyl-CoA thioesterase [Solirubrobacteraceae bacterium]